MFASARRSDVWARAYPGNDLRRRPRADPHPRHRRDRPRSSGARRLWRRRQLVRRPATRRRRRRRRRRRQDVHDLGDATSRSTPSTVTVRRAGDVHVRGRRTTAAPITRSRSRATGIEESAPTRSAQASRRRVTVDLEAGHVRDVLPDRRSPRPSGWRATITVKQLAGLAGEALDEVARASRVRHVLDLERPCVKRAVAEHATERATARARSSAGRCRRTAAARLRARPARETPSPSSRRSASGPSARPPRRR